MELLIRNKKMDNEKDLLVHIDKNELKLLEMMSPSVVDTKTGIKNFRALWDLYQTKNTIVVGDSGNKAFELPPPAKNSFLLYQDEKIEWAENYLESFPIIQESNLNNNSKDIVEYETGEYDKFILSNPSTAPALFSGKTYSIDILISPLCGQIKERLVVSGGSTASFALKFYVIPPQNLIYKKNSTDFFLTATDFPSNAYVIAGTDTTKFTNTTNFESIYQNNIITPIRFIKENYTATVTGLLLCVLFIRNQAAPNHYLSYRSSPEINLNYLQYTITSTSTESSIFTPGNLLMIGEDSKLNVVQRPLAGQILGFSNNGFPTPSFPLWNIPTLEI